MSHFFISYERDSKEDAQEVKRKIETLGEGLLGWIDAYIPLGDDWKRVIDTEIKNSLAVIVLVTVKALRSQYVTYEWSYALGLGKRVIPLIFEEPDPLKPNHPKIHPKLENLNWAVFIDAERRPWERLIQELSYIRQRYEIPPLIQSAEIALQQTSAPLGRKQIIETLRDYEHPAAIEALARAVDFPLPDVSINAAFALAYKTRYLDERALPGLERGLYRSDTQKEALSILTEFNSPGAVSSLARAVEETPEYIQGEIIQSIAKISDRSAITALRKILLLPGTKYGSVVEALGNFRDPQAVPDLLSYLEQLGDTKMYGDRTELAKASVIKALGKIGSLNAIDSIEQQLKTHINGSHQDDLLIVHAAADALQNIGTIAALEVLEKYTGAARVSNSREAIANAINNLRSQLGK